MIHDPLAVKARLYQLALSEEQAAERALAGAAYGANEDNFNDFIDFFALEWVDAGGRTLLEQLFEAEFLTPHLPWITGIRFGAFVVDDWQDGVLLVRDAEREEVLRVRQAEPLPRRSVLVGRLLPVGDGSFLPSGEPELYDPMSMMARLDLVAELHASGRLARSAQLAALREAFLVQREQQRAFVRHFGRDELTFDDGESLRVAMEGFIRYLLTEDRPPSLGGATHAELRVREEGLSVPRLVVELGSGLGGEVGVIYDAAEGLHFLPGYPRFVRACRGEASDDDIVRAYARDPGVTRLPFLRHATAERLAATLELAPAPLEALLDVIKPTRRAAPSLLPGFEVGRAENARGFPGA